jgi:hypothetical protein
VRNVEVLFGDPVLRGVVKSVQNQDETPFQGFHQNVDQVCHRFIVKNTIVSMHQVADLIVPRPDAGMQPWHFFLDKFFKCVGNQQLPVADNITLVAYTSAKWLYDLWMAASCHRAQEMPAAINIITLLI